MINACSVKGAGSPESLAVNGSKQLRERYLAVGGSNATSQFPPAGNDSWVYWGEQLPALEPDLIAPRNGRACDQERRPRERAIPPVCG